MSSRIRMIRDWRTSSLVTVAAMVASLMFGFQTSEKKSFEISVTVENLKTPARLILTIREPGQWTELKAESNAGHFVISSALKEPAFAYLVMKYGNETDQAPRLGNVTTLFIENGMVDIRTKDSLRDASIHSGPLQKELDGLNQSLKLLKPEQVSERSDAISRFVRTHPDSFVSLHALQNFSLTGSYTIEADQVAPLFKLLTPKIRETLAGRELGKDIAIAAHTAVGSQAADFTQQDSLHRNVSLQSFRGKYVLIDFWASWCRPCRAENPALVKAYTKFKEMNFTIVGVSLDNSRAGWLKAIRKDGLTWTQVSDLKFWKNEVALQYGVKTVPQNFLLDPNGKIIAKNIRGEDLAGKLHEILGSSK